MPLSGTGVLKKFLRVSVPPWPTFVSAYQSNFTPNFAMRGGSTVVAFSNAAPVRQLMLIAVFEFIALNRSKNRPDAAFCAKRICFSTRKSNSDDRVLAARADRLDEDQLCVP